jgi:predicted Rossmann fold nucleotide-binding protein DprA/Smf involved in DNA uptake
MAAAGAEQSLQRFLPRLEVLDVERDLEVGAKFAACVVCPGDPEWPLGLDDLSVPPYCLWVRGPVDVASSESARETPGFSRGEVRACSTRCVGSAHIV